MSILIQQSIKYLGVRMGNVTSKEAFFYPLAKAQRRASLVASLHLSLCELWCSKRCEQPKPIFLRKSLLGH